MQVPLRAAVALGELTPEDVRVEIYAGRLNAQREFAQTEVYPLELAGQNGDGTYHFVGTFTCAAAGSHGYTLRVVPSHPDLQNPLEMGWFTGLGGKGRADQAILKETTSAGGVSFH